MSVIFGTPKEIQTVEIISPGNAKEWVRLVYMAYRECYSPNIATLKDTDKNYGDEEKMIKFIQDKIDSSHESPTEHLSVSFSISGVSRALTHQLVRHRIASYSHQSQRYVSFDNATFVVPPRFVNNPELLEKYKNVCMSNLEFYKEVNEEFKDDKHVKEDARMVLPNATTSNILVTMNFRSLMNFFSERCCMRAQWEIRYLANLMLSKCQEKYGSIFDMMGPKCKRLGYCPENNYIKCISPSKKNFRIIETEKER